MERLTDGVVCGEPEIGDPDFAAIGSGKDVFGFQIPMVDALTVTRLYGVQDL